MKKAKRVLTIFGIVLGSILLVFTMSLFIYSRDSYRPLEDMNQAIEELDASSVTVVDDFDQISFFTPNPTLNIVIVPGGKVKPNSYRYLAMRLALEGYDVTIVKTLFDLAILTPNYGARFLREDIDNVVIGHSLGGTVASLFSSGAEHVRDLIFLASYPISDVTDKRVLLITAEMDEVLDRTRFDESQSRWPEDRILFEIEGGNHAQFGWYGSQTGDGTASLTAKEQQEIVIAQILDFIR